MLFAAIEILIYATSLAGVLSAVPFGFWFISGADPNSMLIAIISAPVLMWACAVGHWHTYERLRPTLLSLIYATASYLLKIVRTISREIVNRREQFNKAEPWSKTTAFLTRTSSNV